MDLKNKPLSDEWDDAIKDCAVAGCEHAMAANHYQVAKRAFFHALARNEAATLRHITAAQRIKKLALLRDEDDADVKLGEDGMIKEPRPSPGGKPPPPPPPPGA